jgi:cytochrome d ubiquinol oxidase subunit I
VSKAVSAGEVAASIGLFGVVYTLLFLVWLYVMNDKIQHGPTDVEEASAPHGKASVLEVAAEIKRPGSLEEA